MEFQIRMGQPEMESLDLSTRKQQGKLDKSEGKLVKALGFLSTNPRHNSLASHEIDDLTRKHGVKVFQSYLENNTPAAGRLFWAYGPEQGEITVLAVEPHPEQISPSYQRPNSSALQVADVNLGRTCEVHDGSAGSQPGPLCPSLDLPCSIFAFRG